MIKLCKSFSASRYILLLFLIMLCPLAGPAQAQMPEDSAVILMYHRFGEDKYPSTNITLEQFDAHLEELKKDKYNIVPLETIVKAFRTNVKLPPRTIAITIDDAYLSILENAWPRLRKAGFPFTLFVSTEPVNRNIPGYLNWRQIQEMARDPLVTIGHHAHSHDHLLYMSAEQAARDIDAASATYQKELGYVPEIFAYPFGEYNPALQNTLKKRNITAAFGQYSSAASSRNDLFALPRFAFNERYSDMNRFRLIVNARALPAHDILPINPVITQNPPHIGFTVDDTVRGLSALSCYPSHLGKAADLKRVGDNRIEVRFDAPLPEGRSRINCTMPGPDKRWYWFGLPFFVK